MVCAQSVKAEEHTNKDIGLFRESVTRPYPDTEERCSPARAQVEIALVPGARGSKAARLECRPLSSPPPPGSMA